MDGPPVKLNGLYVERTCRLYISMPTNNDQFPDLEKSIDDFESLHRRLNRERRLISLDASEVAEQPFLVWNAFVIVVGELPPR